MSRVSNNLVLWTHYYDGEVISRRKALVAKFGESHRAEHGGFSHTLHRYDYQAALDWQGFCGGGDTYSYWLSRQDILAALAHFGFHDVRIGFDHPDHPNGPAFSVVAMR